MPKIVSQEMQDLLETQKTAEARRNAANLKLNEAKKRVSELRDSERTHRLCTRGAHLEHYLGDPEMFTDEEVCKLIDFLFMSSFVKTLIRNMLAISEGKAPGTIDQLIESAMDRQRTKDAGASQADQAG